MLPRRLFAPSSHHLLLLAIFLAAFLRFWQLGEMPPGLYHDEAYNGLDALSLLQGKTFPQFYEGWELYAQDAHADNPPTPTRWPLFFEGNYGREPLHIYLMALAIWIFGSTPFALRFIPALAGVFSVFTTYLAAKEIVNSQWSIANGQSAIRNPQSAIPLFAAFFMAILFSAVHFSHFGLRMTLFVPAETLAVYFFWRGINQAAAQNDASVTRSPAHLLTPAFLLAGVFLGLGVYIYAVGRLLPLLFVAFVPLWFAQDRAALRRHWRDVALMAGVSLATALPLLLYFVRYPYFFIFRMSYVANKGLGTVEGRPYLTWLNNVGRVIRGLFWLGETHLRHNLPGRPYLDPIQAVLFVLGAGANGRFGRSPRARRILGAQFLFLWLIVMLLPTIMSGDAPHFGRMSGAAPVIAIFLALGLAKLTQLIQSQLSSHSPFTIHHSQFIILFLLAASLFFTVRDYFFRYASHPQLAADFYLPDWELGQYAAAQLADTSLFLTPTQEEMATIYFALDGDTERIASFADSETLTVMGPPQSPTLYLIRPSQTHHLAALQKQFPGLIVGAEQDNFIPALLPADAPRPQPQHLADHSWDGQIRLLGWSEAVGGQNLIVTLFWQAEADMALDYTAFVHLLDENGELVTQLDRQPDGYPTSDWRAGEIIMDEYVVVLPPGEYQLQTGFYYLPTLEPLGTAVTLGTEHH